MPPRKDDRQVIRMQTIVKFRNCSGGLTVPNLILEGMPNLSSEEMIDSVVELIDGSLIMRLNRVDHTVLDMIFQYYAAHGSQCGSDCRKLYQDFGTVSSVLYHSLHRFQMAYGSCQPVDNSLGVLM